MSENNSTAGKKKKGKDKNKSANNKQEVDRNDGNPKGNEVGNGAPLPIAKRDSKPIQVLKEPAFNIREPERPNTARDPKILASEETQKQSNKLKPQKQKSQSKCNKCEAYLTEMNHFKDKAQKVEEVLKRTKEGQAGLQRELQAKHREVLEKNRELQEKNREQQEKNSEFDEKLRRLEKELSDERAFNKSLKGNTRAPAETLQGQRFLPNVDKMEDQHPGNIEENLSWKDEESPDTHWGDVPGCSSAGIEGPDNGCGPEQSLDTSTVPENERQREWFNNQHGGRGGHQNRRGSRGWSGSRLPPRSSGPTSRVITEIDGDLFTAPPGTSLAHCVAQDLGMSSGVAVDFRFRFKRVGELLDQRRGVGDVAILDMKDHYVYYLITKSYSTGKPVMEDVVKALDIMCAHAVKSGVTKLAMPKIGCGLDRLNWWNVKQAIDRTFGNTNIEILVYNFNPDDNQPSNRPNVYITHVQYPLVQIEHGTGLVFFGSADGEIGETSLPMKYDSNLKEFSREQRKVGDVVRIEPSPGGDVLYGLVVKERRGDRLSYRHLEECMKLLKKHVATDQYEYVGLEAFLDGEDPLTVDKVVNVLRNGIKPGPRYKHQIYVCWPEHLRKHHKFDEGDSVK